MVFLDVAKQDCEFSLTMKFGKKLFPEDRYVRLAEYDAAIQQRVMANAIKLRSRSRITSDFR